MNLRIFALNALLILQTSDVVMSQDSREKDSLNLKQTTELIYKMDSLKAADSIKQASLLKEIEKLKGTEDNKQKQLLIAKLRKMQADDSIRAARIDERLTKLKATAKGFPVAPFRDTLFFIYTKVGSFSPSDRANAITTKIKKLYRDYEFNPDSLTLSTNESSTDVLFRDMMIVSINELEALWYHKQTFVVANDYKTKIQNAIRKERKANSFLNISLRIGAIVLILAGIYAVILLINKLFKQVTNKATQLKGTLLKGIRFRGYEFLDSQRQLQFILFFSNALRLLLIGLAMYIALPLLFSVFPWTRGIAETLIGWIVNPLESVFRKFIHYLPNLFTIAVIILITHYFIRFLKFIAGEIENESLKLPGFYPDWAKPTLNIIKFLVYAFSFIIIFPYLPGSGSPIFQGVSVFVGVLFSLGSSSAIANAVAGLVITYMRPFRIGDRVKIGELSGDVLEKSLLVTRIRTIKNENITIPNSSILAGHVINYTTSAKEVGLILYTGVTIGYDVPWTQVHELLIRAAVVTKGIMSDDGHRPFVLQTSLDDFYVAYQINAYTEESHRMASIYSELHQHIQDKFNEAGVEILSPHYRAARDGNMTTVPANYLPKDYQAPMFNVNLNKPVEK